MHIYRYENTEELAVLTAKTAAVAKDEVIEQAVIDQMFELMHKHHGIGLAAPQVGISKSFFIVEVDEGQPLVFINPQIIATSSNQVTTEEGCLSIPGLYAPVTRYASITMQAEDRQRKPFKLEAKGLLAICLQHELDHLNGILHIDRLNDEKLKEQLIGRYYRKFKAKKVKS